MQIGLFSNGNRNNALAKTSYDEDLHEVILADRLGISEAWISEHGTFLAYQRPDQLPSADLFICKAAALTKQIRMGPGIRPLPFFHPLQIATDCAVCDHLTGGRYIAGFGVGINAQSNKQRGTLVHDPRIMFREAVDLILKAWEAPEPFDWNGTVWQGEKWHIIPKPMTRDGGRHRLQPQRHHAGADRREGLPAADELDANGAAGPRDALDLHELRHKRGAAPARSRARVGRVVYVCNSVAEAKRDLRDAELVHAYGRMQHVLPPGGSNADLTFEKLIDRGFFICGDPDTVYDGIKNIYDEVGGFGTLLLIFGKDWGTLEQRCRSMERFMAEVAPRLAALDPDKPRVASAAE